MEESSRLIAGFAQIWIEIYRDFVVQDGGMGLAGSLAILGAYTGSLVSSLALLAWVTPAPVYNCLEAPPEPGCCYTDLGTDRRFGVANDV